MIAEIMDPKASFAAVINYNERVVRKGKGEILSHHNMISLNAKERIDWLEAAAQANARIKFAVFHVALAFDYSDKLGNELLDQIGNEYMGHMGYANTSYLIYRHEDKKHTHIHIVGSRVDLNGHKVNDSFEQYKSEALCRNLEIKHNLRQLGNGAEPITMPVGHIQSRMWDREKPVFNRINNEVQYILKEDKPTNFGQFQDLAKEHYIDIQEKKGEEGQTIGLVYAIVYENGIRDHKGIAGLDFRHDYSLRGLNKSFAKNAGRAVRETEAKVKPEGLSDHDKAYYVKEIKSIYQQVLSDQFMSEAEFIKKLQKIGVVPMFASNKTRHYGISFKFPSKGDLLIKGSDLDRTVSFNIIKGRIIGEGTAESQILDLLAKFYNSTFKFHDPNQKITQLSLGVLLSRMGFKVAMDGRQYLLTHLVLSKKTLKIAEDQIKLVIGVGDIAPTSPDQWVNYSKDFPLPLHTRQWKALETIAGGDAIKLLSMLRYRAFLRSDQFAIHPEEMRLLKPQVNQLDKLISFQARLLGSLKLMNQTQGLINKRPLEIIAYISNVLRRAGIALFTDQRGNWILKDYQVEQVVSIKQTPIPEKELQILEKLLTVKGMDLRFVTGSQKVNLSFSEDHRPFELFAALVKKDYATVSDLESHGVATEFTPEELSLVTGHDKDTPDTGEKLNKWDNLLNDIDSLANFFLYDSWHGITDEDQRPKIRRRKKGRG